MKNYNFNTEEIEILLEILEEKKQVCEEFKYTKHLQTLNEIYSKLIVLNNKTDEAKQKFYTR